MDAKIREKLSEHFPTKELHQIVAFLDRGFSVNGQTVIASIFLYAKKHGKPLEKVLTECEKEWERNWGRQHPDIRGDGDAPGGAGLQNRTSVINIYHALGVPVPPESKQAAIPRGPFLVLTENSTYRFGPANDKGERDVSREPRPFDCARCRIISLIPGYGMEFVRLDGPKAGKLALTSAVTKIE